MRRRLSAEERALWAKVVASVRPLAAGAQPDSPVEPAEKRPATRRAVPRQSAPKPKAAPGTTLDASWDRRLVRGLVAPDAVVDLHGHNLAAAYALLDSRIERAIAGGARLLLLITGKPPSDGSPGGRGAIRGAVDDWLAASRHAGAIAAVRTAHQRHGGAGALYIVLRRRRAPPG